MPDISFAFHQCAWFTHNTKDLHETFVKRICQNLQGTNDKGLVLNPSKKNMVDCYVDADFVGMWEHENLLDPIFANSSTGFVVKFSNCNILWVSNL